MGCQPALVDPDGNAASRLQRHMRQSDVGSGVTEQHRQPQRRDLRARHRIAEPGADLGQAATAAIDQQGEPRLLARREPGHVGVLEDVCAVLVKADVGDRHADLVQQRSPVQ